MMIRKKRQCEEFPSTVFFERSAMRTSPPSGKVARMSAAKCSCRNKCKDCYSCRSDDAQKCKSSLQRVLRYRNDGVVLKIQAELRARGKEITRAEAEAIFQKTLTFLHGTQTKDGRHVPTEEEDRGWHTFILFTMDYQKFCHKYFGRFIHHVPNVARLRRLSDTPQARCRGKGGCKDCRDQSCRNK